VLDIFEERDNLFELHPLAAEPAGASRSDWFDISAFYQLIVTAMITAIDTPTVGTTIRLETTDDDRDSQPSPALWTLFGVPYTKRMQFAGVGSDVIADTGKWNILTAVTVPPVRAVAVYDRIPARYVRAFWQPGATSSTFRIFAMGK